MTTYINTPRILGKADWIVENAPGAKRLSSEPLNSSLPSRLEDVPDDMEFVIVVNNGMFEAAAIVNNTRDFQDFYANPDRSDNRPREFLYVPKSEIEALLSA